MTNSKTVRDALREIDAEHEGRITAAIVVETARDSQSALHDLFEWDVEKAAYHWHIRTAQKILAAKYVETTETTRVVAVAYVRDPRCAGDEPGYVSTERVKTDVDLAREVLFQEFMRIDASIGRMRELSHLFGLTNEMDKFEVQVEGWREKVRNDVHANAVQ